LRWAYRVKTDPAFNCMTSEIIRPKTVFNLQNAGMLGVLYQIRHLSARQGRRVFALNFQGIEPGTWKNGIKVRSGMHLVRGYLSSDSQVWYYAGDNCFELC